MAHKLNTKSEFSRNSEIHTHRCIPAFRTATFLTVARTLHTRSETCEARTTSVKYVTIQLHPHSKYNASVGTDISRIMLEMISVYFEHCMEHNALCGQTAHFVYSSGNTYSNHRALKG